LQGIKYSGFTLLFEIYSCSFLIATGDYEETIVKCEDVLQKIMDYFDGNEYNDLIYEPLVILTSAYM
jgi:hypothetical protein